MCDGCQWKITPNPAASPNKIQAGVPFWIEDGEPCGECVEREFHKLYNSCPDGRCSGPRDCDKHGHLWEKPDDWPESYPKPQNATEAGGINPYHRGDNASVRKHQAEREARNAQYDDPIYWKLIAAKLSDVLGEDEDGNISDASIARLARKIEQRRIEEWGDPDSSVGEPLSLVMGIIAPR